MSLRRVHYLATGGTIASSSSSSAAHPATPASGSTESSPLETSPLETSPAQPAAGGVTPTLTAADLLASVGALPQHLTLTTEQFTQTASTNLTFAQLAELAARATHQLRSGAAGVVVTQGTDTIEETSFALSLLNPTEQPIIVTGAMRNPTLLGADGAANILGALLSASSDTLLGVRAAVVFNDELHDPWFVRKGHTSNPATFTSGPAAGPIGWLHEGAVRLAHQPARPPHIEIPRHAVFPSIALVTLAISDPLPYLRDLPSMGYAGVVLDAFGGGHVSADHMRAIRDLASQVPVIFGSRTGAGETLRATYNFEGSEMSLLDAGCLSSGVLTSRKARVALALLTAENPANPVQRWEEFSNRF